MILVIAVSPWRNYYYLPKSSSLKTVKSNKRIGFYDFLKGVSIVAVIIIHAGYFYVENDLFDAHSLFLSLSNGISRFCIPIFFICSGILLLPWSEIKDKGEYYKKKFLRIFLPYTILVSLMVIYFNASIWTYLKVLFNGQALAPFYFIIVLLQLYLVYPILSKYRRKKYFLIVTFLISFVSALVFDPVVVFGAVIFVKFLFFFAYGIYMRDYFLCNTRPKKQEIQMWLVIIFFYILILFFWPQIYYNFRLFYGLAIFNLLYYYRDALASRLNRSYKALSSVGVYSLWIFLFHFLIEKLIYELFIDWQINFYLSFILIILFTLLFSYLLARIVSPAYNKMLKVFDLN